MSQGKIFAIKFGELERQYDRLLSRSHLCQTGSRDQIRQELTEVLEECLDTERLLQRGVNSSRSPAVAALSEAQLSYDRRVRQILQDELPGYSHRDGGFSEEQVEAAGLYGEYAIDYAVQAMRYALLAALSATEAQLDFDEQRKESI